MKAIIINQYGGPEQLKLQQTALPRAGNREVLVRVHAAGINPVDYKIRKGALRVITGKKFPMILGGDIAGVVEHARRGSDFRPGDKVFAMLPKAMGGYAEFVSVKEKYLCQIPETLTMAEAAATPMAALTALKALLKNGTIHGKDHILVNGASGGVGSFAVQMAKAMGATVTGVCSSQNVEFVKSLGADHVIDYTRKDFTRSPERYHKIVDAVGKSSFSRCKKILQPAGIFISTLPSTGLILSRTLNSLRSKKAYIISVRPSASDLQLVADFIAKGQLQPRVEKIFSLQQAVEAHKMIQSGHTRGKIVFTIIPPE